MGEFENKCPTNFSLSPSFDKLKLVGHQTEGYAGNETEIVTASFNSCEIQIAVGKSGRRS
jgi:hypothetical protein